MLRVFVFLFVIPSAVEESVSTLFAVVSRFFSSPLPPPKGEN